VAFHFVFLYICFCVAACFHGEAVWRRCSVPIAGLWVFIVVVSSECHCDVATYLGVFYLCCPALVFAGRDALMVVVLVMQWWW